MTNRYAIDTTDDLSNSVAQLKANDIVAVGRYLSLSDWKRIQRNEAVALTQNGIQIFTVYQDAQNAPGDFSAAYGTQNGTTALQQAQAIGQPAGSAIYFAVDYDASQNDYDTRIKPYFEAVRTALAGRYKPGVYGSGLICQNLLNDRLVDYCWLSESSGYRDHQTFLDSGNWNLSQEPATNAYDKDLINPQKPDFGGFRHLDTPSQQNQAAE
ncbi:DUF1906 domain-containing protein [Pseudovibrio exalbescens]|uniref:DUF1906 domain-containing protein n=1 Tax=Pseudovibrio exalbescens TaxID=197461 RepID=UPI0023664890|nr:DUF1906 domain-containing protein [Pseudovibrio exalbescens]MDD7909209.1 DUF1906 domain-containing protein [Pseudovibrio exalbescens]